MENLFKKMFGDDSVEEASSELMHREESMTPKEKQNRLAELREWKEQVRAGMATDSHPDDAEQLDKIDEEIRKLEQEQ